jgi:hypothetical protein
MSEEWFDDLPVVGVLDEDDRSEIALSMGERLEDKVVVDDLNVTGRKSLISSIKAAWGRKTAYEHTSHIFGHIRPTADSNTEIPLTSAISLQADEALRGARIKVTLDQVRIAKNPGGGLHEMLFDFYGQNQVEGDRVEHVHFNSKYSGMEGDEIGVLSPGSKWPCRPAILTRRAGSASPLGPPRCRPDPRGRVPPDRARPCHRQAHTIRAAGATVTRVPQIGAFQRS